MRRRNIARLRRTQGCLTDAVAYVLNLHPERVPYFVYPRAGWMSRLRRFFRKHGYRARWVRCDEAPRRGVHIVCGNSLRWKTSAHVVVYRAGKCVYDPDWPSQWTAERMTHRLELRKV
jgi:hypothetical protein